MFCVLFEVFGASQKVNVLLKIIENEEKAQNIIAFFNDAWANIARDFDEKYKCKKGKRKWSTTMLHICHQIYAASPATYEQVRGHLGLMGSSTLRKRMKQNDFEEGCSEELERWSLEIFEEAESTAAKKNNYAPTRTGTKHNIFPSKPLLRK